MFQKIRIPWKWIFVCLYTIALFSFIPYLPSLIKLASAQWSSSGVALFVFGVEIIIAILILTLAIRVFIYKRKKAIFFLIFIGGFLSLSFFLFQRRPNPYEFTHLPEYAILCILIIRALDKRKKTKSIIVKNSYFLGGMITGVIGTGDEIYQYFLPNRVFNLYDILLNILGGILGLLIIWEIKR